MLVFGVLFLAARSQFNLGCTRENNGKKLQAPRSKLQKSSKLQNPPQSVSEKSHFRRSSRGDEAQTIWKPRLCAGDQSLVTSAATIFQTRSQHLAQPLGT